jgi:hypothetical protein
MEKIQIKINPKFYKKEAVEESLKAFSDNFDYKIIDDSLIEIESEDDLETVKNEFYNYVLALMKNKSMV